MAILNITYDGLAVDVPVALNGSVSDADVIRIAIEVIRSGEARGLHIAHLSEGAFAHYVVDRFRAPGGEERIYLRPKVPFGAFVLTSTKKR